MLLTIIAWSTVILFMALILTKKMHPFTAIVLIPVLMAVVGALLGLYQAPAAKTLDIPVGDVTIWDQVTVLGTWVKQGLTKTSGTAFLLFFAIMFFSLMLNVGVFDPLTKKVVQLSKGDPLKVLVGTSILSTVVSMSGDGTTTTLICCTAFIPVYKRLNLKMMHLAVLLILQNTILNLLPWSGPTARVIAVIDGIDVQALLNALLPGMILASLFVTVGAYFLGLSERRRLGVQHLSDADIEEIFASTAGPDDALKRPHLAPINAVLTIASLVLLIAGIFDPVFIFLVGTVLALVINYKTLQEQKERIYANSGEVLATVIMVIGAGVFMGLFTNSGMSDALASSMVNVIPPQLGGFWGLIVVLISAPGGFFLSNDAFFYGVLPVLVEAGKVYGFTPFEVGFASLLGQAFHMLSPLTAFIYLLLSMTGLDMGEWQRACFKWCLGIFFIFIATAVVMGVVPLYR
ncbi:CitMHS family transporter [Neorhizobium alkalisoli]|jgi:CitMHS family citrate-Mg2+:H+ or citrate-Ca2+:H+ symporter|uniref:CitMHS family citrate-Mg2+:H+ or citrate-Ca2+:H+ symporter n=1 Tax=Neorhizobium alkalisoli TaxID=528178 RepID=A0A561R993_9HYPH|nr:citrate:proton symporter [Neorhizobium alkalisoli]TWF59180.1 CitMHS family citrate-Mg2+:H+ or citrate-Ca2+:H+ symporter [Neorhizobium alkalisoli]